jgi:hypothetical protein
VISKTSTLSNEKNLTKGIQSLLILILQGAKKAIFFTLNTIILQSMWSTFLKFFPHITLIVYGKILWLELKKKIFNLIYAICNWSDNFGVFFCKT